MLETKEIVKRTLLGVALFAIFGISLVSMALLGTYYDKVPDLQGQVERYPNFYNSAMGIMVVDIFIVLVTFIGGLNLINPNRRLGSLYMITCGLFITIRLILALILLVGELSFTQEEATNYKRMKIIKSRAYLTTNPAIRRRDDELTAFYNAYNMEIASIAIISSLGAGTIYFMKVISANQK
jgi:hypothetical protein